MKELWPLTSIIPPPWGRVGVAVGDRALTNKPKHNTSLT
jgi:hypothetical protein